jgi:hypothetical protein
VNAFRTLFLDLYFLIFLFILMCCLIFSLFDTGTVFVPWSSREDFYVSFCDCFVLSSASFLDSS